MDFEPLVYTGLGLVLAFLYSYFNQRGKNEAIRRDIHGLTTEVENVKNLFNLKFHTESKLWDKQTDALNDFYDMYIGWRREIQTVGVTMVLNMKAENIEYNLYDQIKSLELARSKTLSAFYSVTLYTDDEEILKVSSDLKETIMPIHLEVVKKLGSFKKTKDKKILEAYLRDLQELSNGLKDLETEAGSLLASYVLNTRIFLKKQLQ